MIKRLFLLASIIALAYINSFSQDVTNSPYTIFGIGDISRNGFNNSKAMGGIATGLRVNNQVNYMNPAAISAQDTMSFIFDVGINGISKNMKSNLTSTNFDDFAFDHLTMSFPIKRWWFAGIGITTYSKIGYNIQQVGEYAPNDTVNMHYDFYGNGGLNQLFLSNSFKIIDNLSLGVNVNYLFGSIEQYNMVYSDISSYTTVITDDITLKKMTFDVGLQYHNTFSEKYFYTIGLTYSNKSVFESKKRNTVLNTNYNWTDVNIVDYIATYDQYIDTVKSSVDNNFKVELPARYSIGFTTGIKNKLTIGIDYSYQDWSDIESLNVSDNFGTDETFNFGLEYIPNKYSLKNYFKHINYRAGAFLNNSYLKLNGKQIKNYGITFGLGFPIANQKTSLNLSCSFGKRGTTDHNLIEENYMAFGVNLTLYDFWFIKRKFQ